MIQRIAIILFLLHFLVLVEPGYGQIWGDITPTTGDVPPPRSNSSSIYDPLGHRMIVFGGRASGGDLNDVWAFDLSSRSWSEITPSAGDAPPPRRTAGGVYDPDHHQMIIWSGQGSSLFNDVWAFDLTNGTWFEFNAPDPKPNNRYGIASIFDPASKGLVTFAGFTDQGRFDDTWRFNIGDTTWTDVTPSEGNPPGRCLHSASYDGLGNQMIMYGGINNSGSLGDIWAFDLGQNAWTNLTPQESPEARYFVTNIYDSQNHRVTIFGGNLGSAGNTSDTWIFNLTTHTWQELVTSGSPPQPRNGAAAIYIEAEDRMVIFGGSGESLFNDVWSLNELSQTADTKDIQGAVLPSAVALYQNYPNPFNTGTSIRYDLSESAWVMITIHDMVGREVRTLLREVQAAGHRSITWDGTDNLGNGASTGIYLLRLQTDEHVTTRKLVLMK